MPKSRALAVITVAFALAGAASGGMSGIAHATLSAPAAPSARAVLTPPPAWQGQAANTDTIAIDPVVQVMDAGGGASGERRGAHCTAWCYIRHPSTDSTGRFSATFADPESATWSAEFFGNSTHLATLAPLASVTVG